MHSRADTASLHAACTSACDELDPRLLQTGGLFFGKKKGKPTEIDTPTVELHPEVWKHFTKNLGDAGYKHQLTESGFPTAQKYGIVTLGSEKDGVSRYFQICNWDKSLDPKNFRLDVKVSRKDVSEPVEFNENGPVDIANWTLRNILPFQDFVYIKDPDEYFAPHEMNTQNKWPRDMPRKAVDAAALKYVRDLWTTEASANPYIVRRAGAGAALGHDAVWQTEWKWPRFIRRSRAVAPEPAPAQKYEVPQKDGVQIDMRERAIPLEISNAKGSSDSLETTAGAKFNYYKRMYWTSRLCKKILPCIGTISGKTVWVCLYEKGDLLLQCFFFTDPFTNPNKKIWTAWPRDLITGEVKHKYFKVPKNSKNVLWFIAAK